MPAAADFAARDVLIAEPPGARGPVEKGRPGIIVYAHGIQFVSCSACHFHQPWGQVSTPTDTTPR